MLCCVLSNRASLYERPVNLDSAKAAHADFRRVMREHGVKVPSSHGNVCMINAVRLLLLLWLIGSLLQGNGQV